MLIRVGAVYTGLQIRHNERDKISTAKKMLTWPLSQALSWGAALVADVPFKLSFCSLSLPVLSSLNHSSMCDGKKTLVRVGNTVFSAHSPEFLRHSDIISEEVRLTTCSSARAI